jgi:hypothetical protein
MSGKTCLACMISVCCIAWDGLSFVKLKNWRLWGLRGRSMETLYQVVVLFSRGLAARFPRRGSTSESIMVFESRVH